MLTKLLRTKIVQYSGPKIQNNLNPLFQFSSSSVSDSRIVKNLSVLHPYLQQNLLKNYIYELKQFQYETLMQYQNNQDKSTNCFINSCTGSGKSLAYLLPILNRLLTTRINEVAAMHHNNLNKKAHQQFQYQSRRSKHGAVILTLNKQLCLQIYRVIRLLDPLQYLDVKRTGPITHYIPVINQLSNIGSTNKNKNQNEKSSQNEADLIDSKINSNLVNTIKWTTTDILISTPQLLYNVMGMAQNRRNNKNVRDSIAADFVVIDQADILLEIDKNVSRHTFKIVEDINKNNQLVLSENGAKGIQSAFSSKAQYIVSTSSFPNKISNIPYLQALNKKFGNIQFNQIKSVQLQHQIPKQIDLFFVEIEKQSLNKRGQQLKSQKLFYLEDIIKSRLAVQKSNASQDHKNKQQRFIIFCNNKKSIQQVADLLSQSPTLKKLDIQFDVYHASLDTNQRSNTLNRFQNGRSSILVSTDLGSRGLDFQIPINCVIEYQMAENVTDWINRVGRTGRNGVHGRVITFVEKQKDVSGLFEHLQEIIAQGGKLDQLFSRKRSYNKLYKNKQNGEFVWQEQASKMQKESTNPSINSKGKQNDNNKQIK